MSASDGRKPLDADIGPFAQALLEAAGAARIAVAITFVDGDAPRNVFVNDAAVELFGYPREVLLGGGALLDLVAPEEREHQQARYAARKSGDERLARSEVTIVRGDRTRVPIEVAVGGVMLAGRRATVTFSTDITERRRAEEEARLSEARFRELIEAVPEAIAIMRNDHFVYANPAYLRLLGYPDTATLRSTPMSSLLDPNDAATLRDREQRVAMRGETLQPHVYRVRRHDGSFVLLEATSVQFVFEGAPAILAIGRDVTERKRMESQLLQADRLAALGTLAAGVAHEVNNPLAYLTLNLEWLARQLPELARDPTRLSAMELMLEEARHGADRVAAIVRDLRTFSRADGETRGPVDLAAAVASATKMAAHDMRHRANVVTELGDDVPLAWANEARLEQVLLNLLLNAVQAMDETTADRNEIRVTVRAGAPGRAIIEVADNGAGIPPEQVRRIFDPFFTTKSLGTGLGLSICHSIVTGFGGRISVQSRVGEGSTFRIELPTRPQVADSVPPIPTDGTDSEPPPSRRARVLVVDDETAIANTLRELLQPEHEVTAVTSGADAIEQVRSGERFDVVLCDLMMPHMSGIDLYDRLREMAPGLEARVVFMTGGAFTPRAAEFLARVPNRRVEKPFAITTVEQVVRSVAGRVTKERGVG